MASPESFKSTEKSSPSVPARSWISRALDIVPRLSSGAIERKYLLYEDTLRRNHSPDDPDIKLRSEMAARAAHGLDPGGFDEQRLASSEALDIVPRTPDGDIDFYLLELGEEARRRDPERAEELLICVEALVALARSPLPTSDDETGLETEA